MKFWEMVEAGEGNGSEVEVKFWAMELMEAEVD